ncbi:MAG: SH3 domain-containing protein [Anaerolineae bacterium]|nr:SH3 domain-containing protein [Anaerolineae bacterium]
MVLVSCAPSTDAVSSATPSPETYATPYYGQVYVREIIIRQSPDIESSEIARLPQGTGVSVLARQGEWVQIRTSAATGWVLAKLLTITQSPPVPTATLTLLPTPALTPTSRPLPSPTPTFTLLPPATPTPTPLPQPTPPPPPS